MSTQTVEQLYMRLCSLNLSEGHVLAEAILRESRKVAGPFLTRADLPDRGGATIAYLANTRAAVRQLAERIAVEEKWDTTPAGEVTVKMPWYAPADEGELAAHVLWEDSHASLEEIRSKLSPDRVKEVLRAAIGERLNRRHKPGRAFENAFFTYEIVGDYGTFRDMHRMRIVNDMRWQRLTPYHGFDIPEGVKGTEFERLFYEAFALSEELFEYLVQKGEGEETAQYAVLLGHRMRYRMTPNLRELYHILELRSQPAGHPGYRAIAQQMYALLEAVYPITAAGMRFMNMGEDPGLTRLAAELATQRKRAVLGMTPELLEE